MSRSVIRHKNPRGKLIHPSQGQELESAGRFTDQTKNSISSKKCEKVLYVTVICTTEGNKETAKQNHEDDTLSVYGSEDGESVYGSEDGEITAKQNHEDDTLSVYGSEDSEIVTDKEEEKEEESKKIIFDEIATDKEEEKEEESKKIIFKRIWSNFGKKPRKAMFQSTAFDVYSCSHKTIYPGQMERFSLGFKMKMPKGYCAKIYGRSGMTVKHGIHLAGNISIIDPDFRGPISICLKNSH